MGNKNTKYVLGAALTGIVLLVAMVGLLPAVVSQAVPESAALMMGHAAITIEDPDGKLTYIQTDNVVQDRCLTGIAGSIFGEFGPGVDENFLTLRFGSATVPLDTTAAAPATGYIDTKTTIASGALVTSTSSSDPATLDVKLEFPTVTVLVTDTGDFLRTTALTNGAGQACSILLMTTAPSCIPGGCGVVTGTKIQVDYTIKFTT